MNLIQRNISVHLQDFPNVEFIKDNDVLVEQMDLVRNICSQVLSIRDHLNLRVRLPLASLTIIGKDADKLLSFKEVIADEVNVKEVKTQENLDQYAELKLQVNFKKIGSKYSSKVKDITQAMRQGNWQKIGDGKIIIADIELLADEFELKLSPKNYDQKNFQLSALTSNDYLVMLDIVVTKELFDEGIARDIIRSIQQNRKNANLEITQKINLKLFSSQEQVKEVAKTFSSYISQQVLADKIEVIENKTNDKSFTIFENILDDGDLFVAFK